MKNKLLNFFIIIFSLIVSIMISEAIVRVLFKSEMTLFPRYQTDYNFGKFKIRRIMPNIEYKHRSVDGVFDFVSNNKGFRNKDDIEYQKNPNEKRILFLGDSHILGYEVKQSEVITTVLEKLFNDSRSDSKAYLTAINSGVSGTGTSEQLIFFKNEGYKYDLDYVVLGFFRNDLRNNKISNLHRVENDSLIINNYEYLPGVSIQNFIYKFKLFKFLGENSYLYAFMFNSVWEGVKKYRYSKMEKKSDDDYLTERVLETRDLIPNNEINLQKLLIIDLYKYCKEIDVPLIIIDIPELDLSSSIPDELLHTFKNNSDTLFYAPDLKEELKLLTKVHVKNGHRHISAETHSFYAEKVLNFLYLQQNFSNGVIK